VSRNSYQTNGYHHRSAEKDFAAPDNPDWDALQDEAEAWERYERSQAGTKDDANLWPGDDFLGPEPDAKSAAEVEAEEEVEAQDEAERAKRGAGGSYTPALSGDEFFEDVMDAVNATDPAHRREASRQTQPARSYLLRSARPRSRRAVLPGLQACGPAHRHRFEDGVAVARPGAVPLWGSRTGE
jgi:hypothetical protein